MSMAETIADQIMHYPKEVEAVREELKAAKRANNIKEVHRLAKELRQLFSLL